MNYIELFAQTCCQCGMAFGVPTDWDKRRREDHKTFYCPQGHPQSYVGESELERIRRERDRLKQDQARLEEEKAAAQRRMRQAEAAAVRLNEDLKRTKRRAAAGVCPCCGRTVAALARHMKTKHPDVVGAPAVSVAHAKINRRASGDTLLP